MTNLDLQTRKGSSKHKGKLAHKQKQQFPETGRVNPIKCILRARSRGESQEPTARQSVYNPGAPRGPEKQNAFMTTLLTLVHCAGLSSGTSALDKQVCGPLKGRVFLGHITSTFPTAYL